MKLRLDRLLSNLKYGSRTEIKELCKKGLVTVNNTIAFDSSRPVYEKDEIKVDGKLVFHKDVILLILNKPKDYVCANKDNLHKTVLELIKEPYNRYDLSICGRLDIDTEGLVLLTNSGSLMHKIISPSSNCYKKYYVEYSGIIDKERLENGLEILDGDNKPYITNKAYVTIIDSNKCFIEINEGKFHQVKRMFEKINCHVDYLRREKIGKIELLDLPLGEYKEIEIKENLW